MHRFYCPTLPTPHPPPDTAPSTANERATIPALANTLWPLDDEEAHHAARVLRLATGDQLQLFNGQGVAAQGIVESNHKSHFMVRVLEAYFHPPIRPALWIASAVAKGSRPDEMIDQLSQVNATGWIPLLTARSVVDPRPSKLDKLRKTAIMAAKQAGRAYLLQISDPMPLAQALAVPAALRLWATPPNPEHHAAGLTAVNQQLRQVATEHTSPASPPILLYIGPEGGWTEQEQAQALTAGATPWHFGAAIMRIETAAIAGASIAMYLAGEPSYFGRQ